MKVEYEIVFKEELTDEIRDAFTEALKIQGKVQGDCSKKADRCRCLCISKFDGEVAGIGAIKKKTELDFSSDKAALPSLNSNFEWELGYLYTYKKFERKGVAKNIVRLLIDSIGNENLMASTEVSANPAMVRILEQEGFRLYGKPWKSSIHQNYLGLFLKFV